jgi:hypothetical protein
MTDIHMALHHSTALVPRKDCLQTPPMNSFSMQTCIYVVNAKNAMHKTVFIPDKKGRRDWWDGLSHVRRNKISSLNVVIRDRRC